MMIAVLLIEMAPPITTAIGQSHAGDRAMQANTIVVADHLRRAEPEYLALHREHARQRELQPQREQQERHAELGQQRAWSPIRAISPNAYGPSAMPTTRYPRIGGSPQPPQQRHDEQRPRQQYQDL